MKIYLSPTHLLAISLLSFTSCVHGQIPAWNGKLWAGDSARGGITRAQSGEHIDATDPLFDGYIAMSYEDFRSFYATYVLGCKEWYPGMPMMSVESAWEMFKQAAIKAKEAK